MFGRRFFNPDEDEDTSDGHLPVIPSTEDHLKLLAPIQPLLENSGLTVVNFESVIDSNPYIPPGESRPFNYHPTKDYVFASHPSAITALKQAGVDVIDLGNNHVYDMLDPGVTNIISVLEDAGMAHFGAGLNETEAWTPIIVIVDGQKIAFIGCTTIYRSGPLASPNEINYVASDVQKKGGAALCDASKLQAAVSQAKELADIVVVMIHGGLEYEWVPTNKPIRYADIAKGAGATLVINHHPHVVSGFTWDNRGLVAWSLGNFIYDQTIWPTFESYLLTVYVREGKVIRAFVEPVMLKDYVAHGLVGEMADYVARGASGRQAGPFILENGAMEVDINNRAIQKSEPVSFDGGAGTIIPIPQGQWISDFNGTGSLLLGRDIMWVGRFENEVVGNDLATLPLWKLSKSSYVSAGSDFAYNSQVGIRLSRGSSNQSDVVTTNLNRLLVSPESKLSISGMVRGSRGANTWLQVSWYPDKVGTPTTRTFEPIPIQTNDLWQAFQLDVQVPPGIVAAGVFLRLSPPSTGVSTADFDNLRVIEWAPENTPFSTLYNFAYLRGAGEVTFSQAVLPGGEDWFSTFPSEQASVTPIPIP
jgi:poly-gamma-glutamate synthesis protein (capsule biosynthesis protein)